MKTETLVGFVAVELNDDLSRYVTVRGVATKIGNTALDMQMRGVSFPTEVWEGVIEALDNVVTVLTVLNTGEGT